MRDLKYIFKMNHVFVFDFTAYLLWKIKYVLCTDVSPAFTSVQVRTEEIRIWILSCIVQSPISVSHGNLPGDQWFKMLCRAQKEEDHGRDRLWFLTKTEFKSHTAMGTCSSSIWLVLWIRYDVKLSEHAPVFKPMSFKWFFFCII